MNSGYKCVQLHTGVNSVIIGCMRIIKAVCEVQYDGRGATTRGLGERVIIIKGDSTVLVHTDAGVKPLNYMSKTRSITEETGDDGVTVLTVSSAKETIRIIIHEKQLDMSFPMVEDDSLSIVNGTERQLQEWLSRPSVFPSVFGGDMMFLTRELAVDTGSIDLAGYYQGTRGLVAIEVKRHAMPNDVYQVLRYRESLGREYDELIRAAGSENSTRERPMGEYTVESLNTDIVRNTALGRLNLKARELDEENPAEAKRARVMRGIPVEALNNVECWLVAEHGSDKVRAACESHGVHYLEVGEDWRGQTIPADKASRTASKPSSAQRRSTKRGERSDPTLLTL